MTAMNNARSRKGERATVILKGCVRLADSALFCRIADLSATGGRIVTETPLKAGDVVGLTISKHGEFPAVVAWANRREAGLQFIDGAEGAMRRFGEKAELLGIKS